MGIGAVVGSSNGHRRPRRCWTIHQEKTADDQRWSFLSYSRVFFLSLSFAALCLNVSLSLNGQRTWRVAAYTQLLEKRRHPRSCASPSLVYILFLPHSSSMLSLSLSLIGKLTSRPLPTLQCSAQYWSIGYVQRDIRSAILPWQTHRLIFDKILFPYFN